MSAMMPDFEIAMKSEETSALARAVGREWKPMIAPFINRSVARDGTGRKVISYGLSSYGYDARLGYEFKVFSNIRSAMIDPKNFNEDVFQEVIATAGKHEWVSIPPNSFALGVTLERFVIPRNVIGLCTGKSTYARCGIIVNVTPLEPEWEGHITVEISNTTPLPCVVYPGEGILQVIFFRVDERDLCRTSYADKAGKYQNQGSSITLPKV
jgi:dCTP deaminase